MTEQWLPVPGYEGLYEVSDLGRIRNKHGRVLKQHPLGNVEYLGIHLHRAGRRATRTVHSIVLEAFHGPRPVGLEGCHRNGQATDNRACNLRWGTRSSNHLDKVQHGTHNHAKKTRCKRGHLLKGDNLKLSALKYGRRECKACALAHWRIATSTSTAETWLRTPTGSTRKSCWLHFSSRDTVGCL